MQRKKMNQKKRLSYYKRCIEKSVIQCRRKDVSAKFPHRWPAREHSTARASPAYTKSNKHGRRSGRRRVSRHGSMERQRAVILVVQKGRSTRERAERTAHDLRRAQRDQPRLRSPSAFATLPYNTVLKWIVIMILF